MKIKQLLFALMIALVMPSLSFKSRTTVHSSSPHDKQAYYIYGSALLKEKKAFVFTPIYKIYLEDHRSSRTAEQEMQNKLRDYVEGEIGDKVFACYSVSSPNHDEYEGSRLAEIAKWRNQGYDIIHTTDFSYSFSEDE